jgi:hypothetical protein
VFWWPYHIVWLNGTKEAVDSIEPETFWIFQKPGQSLDSIGIEFMPQKDFVLKFSIADRLSCGSTMLDSDDVWSP